MRQSLTDILQEKFGVSEEKIEEARKGKSQKNGFIGEALLDRKIISEAQLLEALSIQYNLPFWQNLPLDRIRGDFTQQIPIQFLKRHVMVPLIRHPVPENETGSLPNGNDVSQESSNQSLSVIAINDPTKFQPIDDLRRILEIDACQIVLSTKEMIYSTINMMYEFSRDSAEQIVQDMEEDGSSIISQIEGTSDLLDDTSDAPIIKLVNHIISQSIKARASDIHIEPYENSMKVRYRVDGILYELLSPPKWIQPALTSRIKVMSKMNIAEKRLPQDGRIGIKMGDQDVDVRISTIPTFFGERVVLRLLNKSNNLFKMSDLGLGAEKLQIVEKIVRLPNGIILVTGPTGSGKTTTLYAILTSINTPDINIITIEDPVEYQIKGISQIQVNPKIDLTFARGLRSVVRQDPDVMLVGEIRDLETAEIAVQSALTGHLVLSTLHTNDSASAITRLVDIGVEPFLISSSLIAVVAQRLVRILCNDCKEPFAPNETIMESIGMIREQFMNHTIYRSKGCENCFHTGFRGRLGIFEIMVLEDNLKSLILKSHDSNLIKSEALKNKMVTLRLDGIQKVLDGITTIEEVVRVT
ncbi:type II secretion system protein GspE [Desulfobacteraceae bacterium SEEP-SAG9]|nr:type II secretion system protein GspE [Desulfobacteraceae bacterium SEEP-SAG9]